MIVDRLNPKKQISSAPCTILEIIITNLNGKLLGNSKSQSYRPIADANKQLHKNFYNDSVTCHFCIKNSMYL